MVCLLSLGISLPCLISIWEVHVGNTESVCSHIPFLLFIWKCGLTISLICAFFQGCYQYLHNLAASMKLAAGLDLVTGDVKLIKNNYFALGADWKQKSSSASGQCADHRHVVRCWQLVLTSREVHCQQVITYPSPQ